jgi:malic enzyme
MKNKSIVIAALGVFLLFNFNLELTAQKHYSKHKKVVVHKSKKSAKVYKFSRNKVVIVKQRRGRVIKTLPVGYRPTEASAAHKGAGQIHASPNTKG